MRSWLAACAGLVLLVGCSRTLECDVCFGPGGFINVDGQLPRTPFTIRICVAGLDIPCTEKVYEKCRPDESCGHMLDSVPPPGEEARWSRRLDTMFVELGDREPKELDGREVTVTIQDRSETRTSMGEFDYWAGGECCGDRAFAGVEFNSPWRNSYPEGWLTLEY